LVEFYSYTEYLGRTIYRHRVWFTGGEYVGGILDTVADMGGGYVV
jgi:hypothetical protein